MSRRDRRHAKQNVKNVTVKKSKALDPRIIAVIGVLAAVFFIGTMLIQRG